MRVAVIGPADADEHVLALAREAGRLLGEAGCMVFTGGLGGVMAAASEGARAAGALTVGVLPGADAADANEYVAVPIATGMGEARNLVLIRSVEAVIAIGRGYGTLSEIAFALRLGKRLALLESWNEIASQALVASSPRDAVRAALASD